MKHDAIAIGRRLKLTREALNLRQAHFARIAGLSRARVCSWETAKKSPDLEGATALCRAYRLTMDWIYRGDISGLPASLAVEITRREAKGVIPEKTN